jgi:hypothetical protein
VGALAGLAVGLWVAEQFVQRRVPLALPSAPTAPTAAGTAAGPSGADVDRLVAAIDRFERAAQRIAEAIDRAQEAPAQAPAAAGPDPRPPGALVAGLPPEGVPLVRAWFLRRLRSELADVETLVANPAAKLGNGATPERLAQARAGWKADAERLLREIETLGAVESELQLARWLEDTARGREFPQAWQLAELAEQLRAGPR